MSARLNRVEEIFCDAIELCVEERVRFLEQACRGDLALRREVEDLLSCASESAALFDGAIGLTRDDVGEKSDGTAAAPPQIPGYVLLGTIGEGGMGVVYEAQQERPVCRRVALKVLKSGMDSNEAIRRFEAERQTLALMEHPNIAKVFDAGTTAEGRLFFAMELVRGVKITEYCDAQRLPLRQRLQLYVTLCQAVQHAHQKGIIHRDLKPSNLLVTIVDGRPVPKVIDFGVAKVARGSPADRVDWTFQDQIIGTPAYMSPEQALGADLDTRCDIYSLGVVLYELAAGVTPFDARELMRGGIAGVRRIIGEQDPPGLGARLRSLAPNQQDHIAGNRDTTPKRLVRELEGELGWIVLKALEKDRRRRYASASALADDVRRLLEQRPVEAGAVTWSYRARKYVRRHRWGVTAATTVLVALLLGLTASLVAYHRAVGARREAERAGAAEKLAREEVERQRHTAVGAMEESEAVTEFLTQMLAAADPGRQGRDVTVRAVVDEAAKTLAGSLERRPSVRARLHATIARTYLGLGLYHEAKESFAAAAKVQRELRGAEQPQTLRTLTGLSQALARCNDLAAAEALAREVLDLYARHPEFPSQDRAGALGALDASLYLQGRQHEALPYLQRHVALLQASPSVAVEERVGAATRLADRLWSVGQLPAAARLCGASLEDQALDRAHPERVRALRSAAIIQVGLDHHAEAERYAREAIEIGRTVLGPDHPTVRMCECALGESLTGQGRVDDGLQWVQRAVDALRGHFGDDHPYTFTTTACLVGALVAGGRCDEAVAMGRETRRRLLAGFNDDALVVPALAGALVATNSAAEAEMLCRESLALLGRKPLRHEYQISLVQLALARALLQQGRTDEAEATLLENHGRLAALDFDVAGQLRRTARSLVSLYEQVGRFEDARAWRAPEM